MVTTPHAVVGASIMVLIPNKLIGLGLAFLSHFLLDFMLPHWNPDLLVQYQDRKKFNRATKKFIIADGLLAIFLVSFIIAKHTWSDISSIFIILAGAGAAVLPDMVKIPYYFFRVKNQYLEKYIDWEHRHQQTGGIIVGSLTQLFIIILCLWLIFHF